MDFGGLLYFFVGLGVATLRTRTNASTSASRLWLRAFLISISLWVVLAAIGFVTVETGEFDVGLLVSSFLLDAGWAAVGAILGVMIARDRLLKK